MIQIFVMMLQLVLLAFFGLITLVFLIRWIRFRKTIRKRNISAIFTIVFGILTFMVANYSPTSQESNDREELVPVFERQFGFTPPESVDKIKAKAFWLYDCEAEWIGFTYDSEVFNQIIEEDTLLQMAKPNSRASREIIDDVNSPNMPRWIELPNIESTTIYYKKDYLNHIQSDFYLWVGEEKSMVYLQTSNHD